MFIWNGTDISQSRDAVVRSSDIPQRLGTDVETNEINLYERGNINLRRFGQPVLLEYIHRYRIYFLAHPIYYVIVK